VPRVDPVFVDPGKVVLSAFKDGHETAQVEVEVAAGQELPVALSLKKVEGKGAPTVTAAPVAPPPPPPRSAVPALVLGGVAMVGVAVGAGLLVGSRLEYDKTVELGDAIRAARTTCRTGDPAFDPRCIEAKGAADTSNALKVGGIIGLSVGGAAAASTIIYWLWPAPKPAQGAVRVVPVTTTDAAGVIALGRF
jgi:hypothetical protein